MVYRGILPTLGSSEECWEYEMGHLLLHGARILFQGDASSQRALMQAMPT